MDNEPHATPGLEAFIDQMIKLAKPHRYTPTTFIGMRRQYGTIRAIERLVESGDIQSGFDRLSKIGLLDWTIEAAVIKFPEEFGHSTRECAKWRLEQVNKGNSE